MLNQVYRLVAPRQFEVQIINEPLTEDMIVVRPTYLSICMADQRYFTGQRDKKVMVKKLPMSLIHEGVGKVIYDPQGKFEKGQRVVMIPNTPVEKDDTIKENYLASSKFRSSGYDGYTQDYVFLRRDRGVLLPNDIDETVAAYLELFSVAMHAVKRMESKQHANQQVYGVWGDGSLGFLTSLILTYLYPEAKIKVFGKHQHKLDYFSFVDEVYFIHDVPINLRVDHIFECVGGGGSKGAIQQGIQHIRPEGTISLLGVSEYPVEIETRLVLEKGLTLFGSSRSGREDFIESIAFIKEHEAVRAYLTSLIGKVIPIKEISHLVDAFEFDLGSGWGKTIMKWEI